MKTSEASQGPERGASAVEYGLLITGIAAVIVVAIYAFGGSVFGSLRRLLQSSIA